MGQFWNVCNLHEIQFCILSMVWKEQVLDLLKYSCTVNFEVSKLCMIGNRIA